MKSTARHTRWFTALGLALGVAAAIVIILLIDPKDSMPAAHMADLVRLPRPRSGAQAELRKTEIYLNKPTGRIDDWRRPEYGAGFTIHINAEDEIEVDKFEMLLYPLPEARIRETMSRIFGPSFSAYKSEHYRKVSIPQLEGLVNAVSAFNEPATIVVTSARPLGDSKVFPRVLDTLFQPFVQISYIPQEAKISEQAAP